MSRLRDDRHKFVDVVPKQKRPSIPLSKRENMPEFNFNFQKIKGIRSDIPFTCFNELYQPLSKSTASCSTFLLFKSERSCSVVGFFRSIIVSKMILRWNEKKTKPRFEMSRVCSSKETPGNSILPYNWLGSIM